MDNLLNFIKEKSYYLLGGTVLIIVLLIIISSCSNGASSYEKIESNMVKAAKSYFNANSDKLPKEDGGVVKITNSTLIDSEYLKEFKDPEDKNNSCSGYVEVTKEKEEYFYTPFLNCPGNYEAKYLIDEIKNVGVDELGNGIYNIGDEYIYRGEYVYNYLSFADQMWRILKIDADGDIKLIATEEYDEERFVWDSKYNHEMKEYIGDNSNYLLTNMRKVLHDFYDNVFYDEEKAKIVYKNICLGSVKIGEPYNAQKECSKIHENEKVSLMNPSDFKNATLDSYCINIGDAACTNRNYLAGSGVNTWVINPAEGNNYTQLTFNFNFATKKTNRDNKVHPVIYLTSKVILKSGDGSYQNPYTIK